MENGMAEDIVMDFGPINSIVLMGMAKEGVQDGLFESEEEFMFFAYGTLISRRVSYRRHGLEYDARTLFLDELENLLDQLTELGDDSEREGNQRLREVYPDEVGDGAVHWAQTANQKARKKAASGLSAFERFTAIFK